MSSAPTLAYQTTVSTWRPPENVVDHNGEPLEPDREYFQQPPPELGELMTAHSTLKQGQDARPASIRLAISLGIAAPFILLGVYGAYNSRRDPEIPIIFGCGIGAIAFLIAFLVMRFKHTCSYVGAMGVARFTLKGSRAANPVNEIFYFPHAVELRTGQTRHYYNGVYTGTSYAYTWSDPQGRTVFKLQGQYKSKQGTPKRKDNYWFANAAERAWNVYQVDWMVQQIQTLGYIQFNLGGNDFVRVGEGFFEFGKKGEVHRIHVSEIKTLNLNQGQFHIHHKDAKWFSSKGKFNFPYAQMANAKLFLYAMEKLTGYTFG